MDHYNIHNELRGDGPETLLGGFTGWRGADFAPHPPPRATPLSMVLGAPEDPPPTNLRCVGPAADHRTFAALAERGRLDELVRLELRGKFTGETLRLAAALPRLEALVCDSLADAPPTGLSFPRLEELSVVGSEATCLVDPQVTPALTRLTISGADLTPTDQAHVRERPLVALTLESVSIERRALIRLLDALRGSLQRLALYYLHVNNRRRPPFLTRWLDGEWPALVELELSGARLLSRLPGGVERLTLRNVELFERAPAPPPGLTALVLSGCEPALVAAFIGHAPRLRALEVEESDEAEHLVAAALAPGGQIEVLSLTGGFSLADQRRVTIPADAPPLRALNLDAKWTLGPAIEPLCAGELSPSLTHLRVEIGAPERCDIDRLSPAFEVFILDAGPGFNLHGRFADAPPPPRLRTFAVSYVNVLGTEQGALGAWLAQCRHLKTLELGFNGFDPNEIAHALRSLAPQLESALLSGCSDMGEYNEEELVDVLCTSSWPNLVFLDLHAFPFGPESSVRVAAATVDMPRLERLTWAWSEFGAGLDALAEHGSPRLSRVLVDLLHYEEAVARLSRADARVANAEISFF